MAEGAVAFALAKLDTILVEETNLLRGVRSEIRDLRDELETMQAFLRDVDAKEESDERLKIWVKQVREVGEEIEDVLDEYMLHVAQNPYQSVGLIGFLHKAAYLIRELKPRHAIAKEIQEIKKRVQEIKARGERYGFNRLQQSPLSSNIEKRQKWYDPRMDSLYIDETEVVGIDKPRDQLIRWLVADEEPRRTVISVVGMGGLGKTTLVKKVFDNHTTKAHFNCHAWIVVSQSFDVENIFRQITKRFCNERKELAPVGIDAMEVLQLIEIMRQYLQQKQRRYVVVFDDVWSYDFWGYVKHALPDNNQGSRVIITTRKGNVACSCLESSTYVYNLQPLSSDQSWELFCKKAFKMNPSGQCPVELGELSHKIVRRCNGLPFAIVAVGGLLSTKLQVTSEWQKLHDSIGYELETNPFLMSIRRILSLSFIDLPYYLKACFLLFGIFPEDCFVKCKRLIRIWVAEGFVEERRGKTLEETAEDYLNELINRNLIHVSKMDVEGRGERFQVHDLIHEIIISKSKNLGFCEVFAEQNTNSRERTRRLSIHENDKNVPKGTSFPNLRSLFLFKMNRFPVSLVNMFVSNSRLLRVLDLKGAGFDIVPEELGNLVHLRYLCMMNTKIKKLPLSIGKLKYLETLDIKRTYVTALPKEIVNLSRLRHILGYSYRNTDEKHGMKVPKGMGSLASLQSLSYVESNQGGSIIKELKNLRQLRKVSISDLKRQDGMTLCTAIEHMNFLRSLYVRALDEEEFLDVQSVDFPPPLLKRLYLRGRVEMLPTWIPKLQNLVRIGLRGSRLTEDPMRVLQALPNLADLSLWEAFDGDHLHIEEKGFQRLKKMDIMGFSRLNSVFMGTCALPILELLIIGDSGQLREVPSGIQCLKSLMEIWFINMPEDFNKRLLKDKGEDYGKVMHIPTIKLGYLRDRVYIDHAFNGEL